MQALRLKADRAVLEVNGRAGRDFALWAELAPEVVCVKMKKWPRSFEARLWSAWESPHGATLAFTGNSRFLLEGASPQWVLRCSSRVGPVNFSDLVVSVEVAGQACEH